MPRTEIAVIGAGAIGLACAWRLASKGHSVVVVDPRPGSGASWAAAGLLAPATEIHYGEQQVLHLNLASARLYPKFVDDLEEDSGSVTGYHTSGTLLVARDTDDNSELQATLKFQKELGLDVKRLRASECREVEPGLASSVRGGILVEGDHQIDNRALVSALIGACEKRGVGFIGERATSVRTKGGRVDGVDAEQASVDAETVVLAAGSWSGQIEGVAGRIPVRPVKGQLLHLRTPDGKPGALHNIRGIDVYIVPRPDGRLVAGATVEERGFDTSITAGAVLDLLRATYELLPGVTEMELVEVATGLRPGSPDNGPIIGKLRPEGLIVATGHFRNGVLQTPVTAEAVVAMVEGTDVPGEVRPFTPDRFDAGV